MKKPSNKHNYKNRVNMFAKEYVVDFNGTQAAIRVGYSARTAKVTAAKLLTDPNVSRLVAKEIEKRSKRVELTADKVLRELANIVFYDPRALYDEDGTLKSVPSLDADTAKPIIEHIILDVKRDDDSGSTITTRKVKTESKLRAIELAMKHLGLLRERFVLDQNDDNGEPITPDERARQTRIRMQTELSPLDNLCESNK